MASMWAIIQEQTARIARRDREIHDYAEELDFLHDTRDELYMLTNDMKELKTRYKKCEQELKDTTLAREQDQKMHADKMDQMRVENEVLKAALWNEKHRVRLLEIANHELDCHMTHWRQESERCIKQVECMTTQVPPSSAAAAAVTTAMNQVQDCTQNNNNNNYTAAAGGRRKNKRARHSRR